MHYHIILTENCNLQCEYCYKKSMEEFDNGLDKKFEFDFSEPSVSKINIQKLVSFISKDPDATIIFYGGEPLMEIDKIKQIMDNIDVPYRMQTNGMLLNLLDPEYLNRITKILISIDGDEVTTDRYRGNGTFEKIVNNIKLIKRNGYSGELVARMTVAQDNPDIYKNVTKIIEMELFDSIHWQLDVGFYKTDFKKQKIKIFLNSYNKSTSKLVRFWTNKMGNEGVLKLYPFIGIAESILNLNKKSLKIKHPLRCGAGHMGYAITTSGNIQACPIMNGIKDFKAGTLETNPIDLKKFNIQECSHCSYLELCGGRCLYWRKASLWGNDGDKLICNSIKYYIDEIKNQIPTIEKLIKNGVIMKSDFNYEKYFGPEIIP